MREKDERIVFQNQSHLMLNYFQAHNIQPTLLDLALATDLMTKFAVEGYSQDLKKRFDQFEYHLAKTYVKGKYQEEVLL